MPSLIETTLETFEADVLKTSNNKPVLVDFWADWCSPCLVIAPLLKQVADEFENQILVAKLEVDDGENMKLAGRYKVKGFPTVMMFEHGEERARFSGAKSLSFIREFIEENSQLLG